jgi:hypothetical protein
MKVKLIAKCNETDIGIFTPVIVFVDTLGWDKVHLLGSILNHIPYLNFVFGQGLEKEAPEEIAQALIDRTLVEKKLKEGS